MRVLSELFEMFLPHEKACAWCSQDVQPNFGEPDVPVCFYCAFLDSVEGDTTDPIPPERREELRQS